MLPFGAASVKLEVVIVAGSIVVENVALTVGRSVISVAPEAGDVVTTVGVRLAVVVKLQVYALASAAPLPPLTVVSSLAV